MCSSVVLWLWFYSFIHICMYIHSNSFSLSSSSLLKERKVLVVGSCLLQRTQLPRWKQQQQRWQCGIDTVSDLLCKSGNRKTAKTTGYSISSRQQQVLAFASPSSSSSYHRISCAPHGYACAMCMCTRNTIEAHRKQKEHVSNSVRWKWKETRNKDTLHAQSVRIKSFPSPIAQMQMHSHLNWFFCDHAFSPHFF